jgi:hypothetical protein
MERQVYAMEAGTFHYRFGILPPKAQMAPQKLRFL